MKRTPEESNQPERKRPKETAQQRLDRLLNELEVQDAHDVAASAKRLDRVLDSVESEDMSDKGPATGMDKLHEGTKRMAGNDRQQSRSGLCDSESTPVGAGKPERAKEPDQTGIDGSGQTQDKESAYGGGRMFPVDSWKMRAFPDAVQPAQTTSALSTLRDSPLVQTPCEISPRETDIGHTVTTQRSAQSEIACRTVSDVSGPPATLESTANRERTEVVKTDKQERVADAGHEVDPISDETGCVSESKRPSGKRAEESVHSGFSSDLEVESSSRQIPSGIEASISENSMQIRGIDAMIERHPYFRDTPHFEERLHLAKTYEKFVESGINDPEGEEKFAIDNDVPVTSVVRWGLKESRPTLINSIEAHEEARVRYENSLPRESQSHFVESSLVYQCFRPLKDVTSPTSAQLTDCIETLYRKSGHEERVIIARLYPYHQSGPMWTRDICKQIEENLTEITKELNARLRDELGSDDIKLGIVGYKLYIRLRNTNPYVWENLYSKENFHFKSLEDKRKLVDDACSHMAIKAETQFSQLVGQLTDYDKTVDDRRPNADLHPYKSQLKGETLHLISDILGTPFAERQDLIDHIGRGKRGWGVIRNPNLRADPERVISTLVGIVMSDGHVDQNCHVTYTDAYPDRLARVREAVSMLGDVDVSEKVNAVSGSRYIHIPAVVGRLLVKTGMVTGDKTIQDERLPEVVRTAPLEAVAGYVRELTADDGSFAVDKTSGEFQWNRSIVLHAGNKTEAYGHKQVISDEEVDYIKTHGEMKTMSFGGAKDTIVHILKVTDLKELRKSPDPETASMAKKLLKTVESNPPRLMEDERQLCEDLGIRTREYALAVRLFDESGRVSVSWQAQTSTNDDAMVWGLVATPNDARKSEKVSEWVGRRIKMILSEGSKPA